ncbi:MAG: putative aspartate transaminase AspC4 [Bacteroidota bacterium]|jgi:aspartate/methionine/tyrosine aminotransferase
MNLNELFSNASVNLEVLRQRAFNFRWAAVENGVIPLTAADPDFPVAEPILNAIKSYSDKGYFSYAPAEGLMEFKTAIEHWYFSQHNSKIEASTILPVNSAANGLYIIASALLSPNDEVIIPNPVDFLFRKSVENAGAKVVPCAFDSETGWFNLNELKAKCTTKTKALFLCNPNNPSGKAIAKKHLNELIEFCKSNDLWLVSDEIWIDIYYNQPLTSILNVELAAYSKKIVVSGLSKNFGLAGLRIGYVICQNEDHFGLILKHSHHQTTAGGISSLSQIAGAAALNESLFWLEAFRGHLTKMKRITEDFIHEMPFLEIVPSDATYVIFPKIVNCSMDSAELVALILKEAKVALVPGGRNWFESASEGHLRICFSTSEALLTEAFNRIRSIQHLIH